MLASLFRTGPLRHHIAKGYIVHAKDAARLVTELLARPPALPAANGVTFRLSGQADRATVWVDTGAQWLLDPDRRRALVRGLAEGTAALAAAVARQGGALVPNGWTPAAAGPGWLCPDLHAVEVLTDVQRELCTNLFRRYAPELIALTARAGFGPGYADRAGSRRLAEAADQVTTRYVHSASGTHLERVRESLRRHDGVARLELMDINPMGSATAGVPNVEVRCLDAQILPVTVVAQALLVQAIAMRARRMERDGDRVPPSDQRQIDHNRSRAIASGLGARFDEPTRGDRVKADPRRDPVAPTPARDRVLRMAEDLMPEFLAMRVEVSELAPALVGASIAEAQGRAVCTETDLVWSGLPAPADRLLHDAGWLARDHLTAANERLSPGAVAVANAYWAARLTPNTPPRTVPATTREPVRTGAPVATLFDALRAESVTGEQVTEALRRYLDGDGAADLTPELRRLPAEEAKVLRRTLRPAPPLRRTTGEPVDDWSRGTAAEVVELARRTGRALLDLRLPVEQRRTAATAVTQALRRPPAGVRLVLLTDTAYRDATGQRVTIEVLVVGGVR
jgi:hypothetical protein